MILLQRNFSRIDWIHLRKDAVATNWQDMSYCTTIDQPVASCSMINRENKITSKEEKHGKIILQTE